MADLKRFFSVSLYPLFCNWAVWFVTDKDTGKKPFLFSAKGEKRNGAFRIRNVRPSSSRFRFD